MNQEHSINGKSVEAEKLIDLSTRLDLVARTIENIQYLQVSGDNFSVDYFLQHGHLSLIYENLDLIKDEIQAVSDCICRNHGTVIMGGNTNE